jgi:hypothetical protein
MFKLDDVETAIIEITEQIAGRGAKENWGQKPWTQNLLSELGQLGHSLGFYVCGSPSSEHGQKMRGSTTMSGSRWKIPTRS